tara:strand:+ start:6195 stop:6395 length:201 start_codon:yes stop_codon:yes gene_type:complete
MIKKNKSDLDQNKIKSEIVDLSKQLMNLKFQKYSGQLEKTHQIKKIKKNIAQLKTKFANNIGEKNA